MSENTFVINEARSADLKNITYVGHFDGGVNNAQYTIRQQAVLNANPSTTVSIHKDDDDPIISAKLSDDDSKLSGFFASMGAIKVSDDYNGGKGTLSLCPEGVISFLTSIKAVAAAVSARD